jgi:hypothetical protein
MIPWMYTDLWKQITDAVNIPTSPARTSTSRSPSSNSARPTPSTSIHPDLASSGGLLETKKIGDMAMEYGHAMAMHFAGTPVSFMANVHCAAATENFIALEFHSQEVPWWEDMVTGIEKPIVNKGFAKVPQGPGLGVELNDEVVKQHLAPGTSYFAPSSEWDNERSWDRLYS